MTAVVRRLLLVTMLVTVKASAFVVEKLTALATTLICLSVSVGAA